MPDKVRCCDCGYLFIQDRNHGPRYADDQIRSTGTYYSFERPYAATFYCSQNAREFTKDETEHTTLMIAAIGKEIECNSFTLHQRGKTSQEHEEMAIVEKVNEANQRARAEDRRWMEQWKSAELAEAQRRHEEDLQWRKSVEKEARDRQDKADATSARSQKENDDRQKNADKRQKWTLRISLAAFAVSLAMPICAPVASEWIRRQLGWASNNSPQLAKEVVQSITPATPSKTSDDQPASALNPAN